MGKSYTYKYMSFEIDNNNNKIYKDADKTSYRIFIGMNIKEVIRDFLSSNNYKINKGRKLLVYAQLNPAKEFIIEITKDIEIKHAIKDNIITFEDSNKYWNDRFKGQYKTIKQELT